jgi:hypothetical protein
MGFFWDDDKATHDEAYGQGVRDARNSSFVDEVFHGMGDAITAVVPGETSEHKSYEAGYHDEKEGKIKR